ncbi:SufE family protein [Actinobacillus porcinus]|uniref:SufE family protein n=1 Tax=Actinobacillus porcinus TaxID=51048 RepID=UPI002353C459|nr:SufE family protein [Actinobacillus porcinus]
MNIEAIKNAPNWEEKYRQLIQLGKNLTKPTDSELAQWKPISGCEVNLWVKISVNSDRTLQLNAYSEARIMNGLLAMLIHEVNSKSLEALANFDMTARFTELGIAQRLSDTRLNGLKQIEKMILALI